MFIGSRLFGGPVDFVLAGSGHIAGVVNPPEKVKYQFGPTPSAADTLEEWMATGQGASGLVVAPLGRWLAEHSGEWTVPREPGEKLGVIEDAPGSYVRAIA